GGAGMHAIPRRQCLRISSQHDWNWPASGPFRQCESGPVDAPCPVQALFVSDEAPARGSPGPFGCKGNLARALSYRCLVAEQEVIQPLDRPPGEVTRRRLDETDEGVQPGDDRALCDGERPSRTGTVCASRVGGELRTASLRINSPRRRDRVPEPDSTGLPYFTFRLWQGPHES